VNNHKVSDVRIDDLTDVELHDMLQYWLSTERGKIIVTTNAEFLLLARENKTFQDQLNASDLSLPDSVSLRYAVAALTDSSLMHRHPGVDVLHFLACLCAEQGKRLLLLGGAHGVAQATATKFVQSLSERDKNSSIRKVVPNMNIVSIDPGHVEYDGTNITISPSVQDQIRDVAPDVVAVALGQGKQEAFMFQARDLFPNVKIWIGVGGAFDMLSGMKRRSPSWMRALGLEFVWRLMVEPNRWRRILNASVVFPFAVALSTLKSHRFLKALARVFPEVYRQLRGL